MEDRADVLVALAEREDGYGTRLGGNVKRLSAAAIEEHVTLILAHALYDNGPCHSVWCHRGAVRDHDGVVDWYRGKLLYKNSDRCADCNDERN